MAKCVPWQNNNILESIRVVHEALWWMTAGGGGGGRGVSWRGGGGGGGEGGVGAGSTLVDDRRVIVCKRSKTPGRHHTPDCQGEEHTNAQLVAPIRNCILSST